MSAHGSVEQGIKGVKHPAIWIAKKGDPPTEAWLDLHPEQQTVIRSHTDCHDSGAPWDVRLNR